MNKDLDGDATMILEIKLPRQSEKHDESLITIWHVSEGDLVEKGDPILEVQTEKAVSDVDAPETGVIKKILKKRGETVAVGEVFALMDTSNAGMAETEAGAAVENTSIPPSSTAQPVSAKTEIIASPRIKKLAKELGVDWTKVKPSNPSGKLTDEDIKNFARQKTERPLDQQYGETQPKPDIVAPPSVRKFAREQGVDLEEVLPYVSNNKISKKDVEDYIAKRGSVETESHKAVIRTDDEERIPLSGIRKAIAKAMVQSRATIPHVTHFDEVNVAKIIDIRKRLRPYFKKEEVKLTYLAFIVKAITVILKSYRLLNATFDEKTEEIILKKRCHIGIATDTDRGLLVPVIKDAGQKSLFEIAKTIEKLAKKSRDGSILADEMAGATFTITNIGSVMGGWFTPIINAPESAILGIGRIEKKRSLLMIRSKFNR